MGVLILILLLNYAVLKTKQFFYIHEIEYI